MIRSLKTHRRPDNATPEIRQKPVNIGRWVYLGFLVLFLTSVVNYLWGDRVILHAYGLVLRNKTVVAATYLAEVEKVEVREGQKVAQGDVVLRLKSVELLERIAALSAQRADLVLRAAELRGRAIAAKQLAPLAERRERESDSMVKRFDSLSKSGVVTAPRRLEALQALYDAREALVRYGAESRALERDLPAAERARDDASTALEDLLSQYADGKIRAPVGGTVGAHVPSRGEAYRAGAPLLEIYSGDPYCLVYLPNRYLFPIRRGMQVLIRDGRRQAPGMIDEILPVSDTLPREFQSTFKAQERNQLARIRFKGQVPFSIHEKVTVSLDDLPW